MSSAQQLLLFNDTLEASAHVDFTISMCNLTAYNAIENPSIWPNNRLILVGEPLAGKSTLAAIWARKHVATLCTNEYNIDDLDKSSVVVENIELCNEHWLFHTINMCMEHGIAMLMTANFIPQYSLKDLQSRINATFKAVIKSPDDTLVNILLTKYFAQYQVTLSSEAIEYLTKVIDRSYISIKNIVDDINTYSMQLKKPITIHLIKEFVLQNKRLHGMNDVSMV